MVAVQPWIGLVHVQPVGRDNPFSRGVRGAFVHALALASGADHFEDLVTEALREQSLFPVEFTDVSPTSGYHAEGRISAELYELEEKLSPTEPVQFDIFDTYRQHDA